MGAKWEHFLDGFGSRRFSFDYHNVRYAVYSLRSFWPVWCILRIDSTFRYPTWSQEIISCAIRKKMKTQGGLVEYIHPT